ncbi:MAG TPA: peptidoglycan DD-metalloendopeptidase family protein [Chitinophagales bacterium]|nr:peptidoglycan DD-metalloendopeptidase family protein [Chitinophagales bacterium]
MLKKTIVVLLALSACVLTGCWLKMRMQHPLATAADKAAADETQPTPVIKYGFNLNDYKVISGTVNPNEFFANILGQYKVPYQTIDLLARESKDVFNLNKIQAGNNYTVLCSKNDSNTTAEKFIYEENDIDYVVFNLTDSLYVYEGHKDVEHKQCTASGVVNSSLWETFEDNNINPVLAIGLSEIFAWAVDFYKIQPGDKFKIVYDADYVHGKEVNVSRIKACIFNSGGKDYYAFYYDKGKGQGGDYYDENGNSMKKQFLKAPVKFSRISSHYSLHRFHPVTKEWKAHLGTDYAAPEGTPIMATADGVIEAACFKQYNGNYVKIRHNGEYETQYLHMCRIAKGMRPGLRVKQGEVIGYVGMTGLATGPHVCYRFWRDGQQVDPYRQNLMFSDPMAAKLKPTYMAQIKPFKETLDGMVYQEKSAKVLAEEQATAENDSTAFDLLKKFF